MKRTWFLVYEGIQGWGRRQTPVWTKDQLETYLDSMFRYNPHLKEIKVLNEEWVCEYVYRNENFRKSK